MPPKAKALSGEVVSKTISRVMSLGDHLSRPGVTARLQRPTRGRTGRPCPLFGLAPDGVYMCPPCYQEGGSLLHCLSTLTGSLLRFISVALSLESPPPDVIWHPALWSPDFPPLQPFVPAAATTCLTQNFIILPYFLLSVYTLKQLPPINSRIRELPGTPPLSTPRK